jgi:hypothetical protein
MKNKPPIKAGIGRKEINPTTSKKSIFGLYVKYE